MEKLSKREVQELSIKDLVLVTDGPDVNLRVGAYEELVRRIRESDTENQAFTILSCIVFNARALQIDKDFNSVRAKHRCKS